VEQGPSISVEITAARLCRSWMPIMSPEGVSVTEIEKSGKCCHV